MLIFALQLVQVWVLGFLAGTMFICRSTRNTKKLWSNKSALRKLNIIPLQLRGLNYSPRRIPDLTSSSSCKNITQIRLDFEILSRITDSVHLYALSECAVAEDILLLANETGLRLFLNLWVDGFEGSLFKQELKTLDYLLKSRLINPDRVMAISVGSESMYRGEVTLEQNIEVLSIVRSKLQQYDADIPTTITGKFGILMTRHMTNYQHELLQ